MRRSLTLTKREQRQVEKQLKKLDAAYQAGRVNEMIYKHKRAQLISNLSRPKAAITPIEANQQGFFQTRRNMEFGPVPVGYWDKSPLNSPARRQVSDNKVRASLLSIHDNEWWNDGFQESLRNAAQATNPVAVEQNKAAQEASYFQQTIMQANRLAGSISADTFQSTEIWNEIQSSAPVMKALQRLSNSVEYTVQRMRTMGVPESVARDAIRKAAIAAGNTMTGAGYDKERAATITAMVVRGELSITGASNQVANDIQQANEAVAALNTNTANTPSAMWRNDYNIHAIGPSGGGVSLKQLQQMRNDLNNELSLENDPVARNQLVAALNNLESEINMRRAGISQVSNAMGPLPPGVAPIATQGNGYNPLNNFRANQSTMQDTVAALTRGGPDLWNIVNDIVTIQGNMYFDYMAGEPIVINENGEVSNFTNMADESTIFPKGDFTVYSSGKASIKQLEIVLSGIANALNSPHIPENEKGYLRYLKNIISTHVERLRVAAAINQAMPNDPFNNLVNLPVNGGEGLPEIIQNNANNLPPTVQNQSQNPAAQHLVQQNNATVQQATQGPANNLPTSQMGLNNPVLQTGPVAQNIGNPWLETNNPPPMANHPTSQMGLNNPPPMGHKHYMAVGNPPNAIEQLAQHRYTQQEHSNIHAKGYTNNIPTLPSSTNSQKQQNQTKQNQKAVAVKNDPVFHYQPKSIVNLGPKKMPSIFTAGVGGSTSTTTSSRSHGGARFVNGLDPRNNHRSW